jgi:hypothetical protein
MTNDRLGQTIIDELRLCYVAEPELLDTLSLLEFGERVTFERFSVVRIVGQHFQFYYTLLDVNNLKVAYLYFGRYGDESNYLWVKFENRMLYNRLQLQNLMFDIQSILPIVFNNITKIDLAKDFKKNVVYAIKRLFKDSEIKTIINGRVVRDRKKVLKELMVVYQASLERIKNPSITICQAEAARNKAKGTTIQAYNKGAELIKSDKTYISEFYGNPKALHRLEVRLNSDEIRDYCKKQQRQQMVEDIFDEMFLTDMYYYHLGSVLRFTRGRKPVSWQEILGIAATR